MSSKFLLHTFGALTLTVFPVHSSQITHLSDITPSIFEKATPAYSIKFNNKQTLKSINKSQFKAAASGVNFLDNGNSITLTWQPIEGASEYKVYEAGATSSDAKLLGTTTECTFHIERNTDVGQSGITLFGVSPIINGKEGSIIASPVFTYGEIEPLPWYESFANAQASHFFWTERTSDQQWGLLTDAAGLPSSDGDNGVFAFLAYETGDYINLHSGKIALTGSPYIVFNRYYRPDQNVELTIVASFEDGTSANVFTSKNTGLAAAYWKSEIVDLTPYKHHRYCTLAFCYTSKGAFPSGGALVALDAIRVIDNKSVDVAAELTLPTQVLKGQPVKGVFTIINNTLYTTPALNVELTANGQTVLKGQLNTTLQALGKGTLDFELPTGSLSPSEALEITATVKAAGDLDTTNDTANASVALNRTWRNGVDNLTVETTGTGLINLAWEAPSGNSKTVVESFEDYEPWSTSFGEWTTVDLAKSFRGGVYPISDYPGQNEQFAFKVMTPETIGETNDARTGRSYLGAPFGYVSDQDGGYTYAASSAWLISPELSGEAQTATVYAASTMAYDAWWEKYNETDENIYIKYSTTGNKVADFKDFCYAGSISNKIIIDSHYYTRLQFVIPEGARYFAIYHFTPADAGVMLRLDDFEYQAGGTPVSYNVYADGSQIANVATPSYKTSDANISTFAVTAIYRDGAESLPVEITNPLAGLDEVSVDSNISFQIYNLQGILIRDNVRSISEASLAPGIYISNGKKIIVK